MMNKNDPRHNKRLLLALVASGLILLVSDWASVHFFGRHVMGGQAAVPVTSQEPVAVEAKAAEVAAVQGIPAEDMSATAVTVAQGVSLPLSNERIDAAVNTTGGRLDQLVLKSYKNEIDDPAGFVFLKPNGAFAEYVAAGWMGAGIEGPSENTAWQQSGDNTGNVTLAWQNTTGQSFQRTFVMKPDSYVVNVTERVVNSSPMPVTLTPFVQVHRADGYWPNERSSWVNYFGPMGVTEKDDGYRQFETKYANLKDEGKSEIVSGVGGWWGITSQYFLTAVMPGAVDGQVVESQRQFRHAQLTAEDGTHDVYTASVSWPNLVVAAGQTREVTYSIYVGPKHYGQLEAAGAQLDRAISWGWFEPLVKGLYAILNWLHGYVGNWGLAVIALTILLKIVTFPLANKSYHSMAKIRKIQPQMEKLKEKHKNNQQALASEMMALYKREKVNPMSGCWPMFIQIPIFFAMYKVVLVMFEFRHAPLGLWITDMSVHDPLYVLPILMGISMWVQFKLNPTPTDPTQAIMFKWLPVFMTVMFLWFPAGLVLYWVTNNVLSVAQQWYIMRKDKAI